MTSNFFYACLKTYSKMEEASSSDTVAEATPVKPKRQMSEAALEKLAIAREKALAKRREMATARREEREQLIQNKMTEVKAKSVAKFEASAEKEARKRLLTKSQESEEAQPPPPPPSKAKKREKIIIEHSDSDEDDIRDARVYFVRRQSSAPSFTHQSESPPRKQRVTETPQPPPPQHAEWKGFESFIL